MTGQSTPNADFGSTFDWVGRGFRRDFMIEINYLFINKQIIVKETKENDIFFCRLWLSIKNNKNTILNAA